MSAENWREVLLRDEIVRCSESIINHALKLEQALDFPNDAPKHYARLVGGTANTIRSHVTDIPPSSLQNVNVLLRELWGILRNAERSRISSTPWSMIQALEEFCRTCVDDTDTSFLIRPQWTRNYSVQVFEWVSKLRTLTYAFRCFPIEEWEQKASACGPKGSLRKIYTVSFPRMERNNVLLHSAFGHEIGHILSESKVQFAFKNAWINEEENFKRIFRVEAMKREPQTEGQGELFRSAVEDRISERVSSDLSVARLMIVQALRELCADAVGFHLFGTAAFAAYAEIAACVDMDARPTGRNDYYPPWRFRLRMIGDQITEQLDRDGNPISVEGSMLVPFIEWLREVIEDANLKSDMRGINADLVTKHSYDFVNRLFPSLRASVIGSLPSTAREPYDIVEQAPILHELLKKLEDGIPPNEIGAWPNTEPATLANVLNAGWAFKLYKCIGNPNEPVNETCDRLCLLLLKSIESAFVHKKFKDRLASGEPDQL